MNDQLLIELPEPDSRTAMVWTQKLTTLLNRQYPFTVHENFARAKTIVDELLKELRVWYELVQRG